MIKEILAEMTKDSVKVYTQKESPEAEKMEIASESYQSMPRLCLNSTQLPVVKDWKVGEEYVLVLKVEMTGMSAYSKESTHADFKIKEIAVVPKITDKFV